MTYGALPNAYNNNNNNKQQVNYSSTTLSCVSAQMITVDQFGYSQIKRHTTLSHH